MSMTTVRDEETGEVESVHAWAVATNGHALFRAGVSARHPQGMEWLPVEADATFQAVTVGPKGAWAVGKDGSCYFRHGIGKESPQVRIF